MLLLSVSSHFPGTPGAARPSAAPRALISSRRTCPAALCPGPCPRYSPSRLLWCPLGGRRHTQGGRHREVGTPASSQQRHARSAAALRRTSARRAARLRVGAAEELRTREAIENHVNYRKRLRTQRCGDASRARRCGPENHLN